MRLGFLIGCASLLVMGMACLIAGETFMAVSLIAIANTISLVVQITGRRL